jgi:hypothetical protein
MKSYQAKENEFEIIDCLPYTHFVCTNGMYIEIYNDLVCSIPLGKGDILTANKEFSIRRTISENTLELYNLS